ncbi:MAG: serine/threonine-protein phosphatase [Clostridia bacterium]|nr:serine/threonine-protein phosphatase [Clostridia bacterium]
MKKLKANVCAVTHAGRIRRENEDNYSLNGRLTSTGDLRKGSAFVQNMAEPFHLSVCDGMGGESYGELASGIANETIAAHASTVYESGEDFSFAISNCLDDANGRICAEINARGKRMGTTLAAMFAVKGKLLCVNIGDTRIYHYSKGILEQISFDHTHAQTIVDAGQAQMDDMYRIPDAKRLTRHLGVFPEEANLSPNISVIDDVDDGDIVLLCSDGLTDMLSDDDITSVLSNGESAQDVASKLVKTALERGGKDNITVIAASMGVEETAIFTPIAAAMVGDSDADYEDEYRNSYGTNQVPDEDNVVSPYAKADARAYVKPVDKNKILKIAGIVIGALAVVLLAALIIKAAVGGAGNEETTTSTTVPVYTYPPTSATTSPWTTWSFESTTEDSSTTTEEDTTTTTRPKTTKPKTTKPKTTKPTTTKPKATTTKAPETTTEKPGTTSETTTENSQTTENQSTTQENNETTTQASETTTEGNQEQQGGENETSAA